MSSFAELRLLRLLIVALTVIPNCSAGFGRANYGDSGAATTAELDRNSNVAQWSAQSAVASAVGRDYANQISTTAQYTNQFTAPVTKEQTANAFAAVQHQQQASLVSAALANAAPAINRAGTDAAKQNFDQAYARGESDRLHGAYNDERERERAWLAGSSLGAQMLQQQQQRHYEDQDKTSRTRTNAAAIQAVHGIQGVDRGASYG